MRYSLDKYRYFIKTHKNGVQEVIAESTYAGRRVKGHAKCNPNDTFSLENGKKLAAARCNMKIAEKRLKNANRKLDEELQNLAQQYMKTEKMKSYMYDSEKEVDEAKKFLEEVLKEMN